jgi:hypothetical protein
MLKYLSIVSVPLEGYKLFVCYYSFGDESNVVSVVRVTSVLRESEKHTTSDSIYNGLDISPSEFLNCHYRLHIVRPAIRTI